MSLHIFTYQGKDTGRQVTLPSQIFGIKPNEHAIYLAVKHFLANQRQGTHKTKTRSQVRGSTRKIQKQKGTGNARRGDRKTNLLRGGGRAFGLKPRSYHFKLNKKQKTLARKSVLSYKAQNNQIRILEDFCFEQPKTKHYLAMLASLSMQGEKTLLVLHKPDKNIVLASRNLSKAKVTTPTQLNTYDVVNATHLLLSESSLALFEKNDVNHAHTKEATHHKEAICV